MTAKRSTLGARKRWILLTVALVLAARAVYLDYRAGQATGEATVEHLFAERISDRIVEVEGLVQTVLADDREGSRHQRFILRLASGQTLLVAHNIDLAPRVPLEKGDSVTARGEYEWNDKGGVLHWTHHDPDLRHEHGWIRHAGKTYR